MRVLVSGGGTAGHIYPALTVAAHARDEEHSDVTFVGAPDSLEARLATEAGFEFVGVPAHGWDRSQPLTFVTAGFTTAVSFFRCLLLLRRLKTDVVIGFGGYVSLPLGLAAAFGGIPLVLHEQNSVPGLANRLLSRWAATVCVTYAESIHRLHRPARALVTGDPVREAVLHADRDAGRRGLGLKKTDLVLLVFGGSAGARHLNSAVVALHPRLAKVKKLAVVHVAGPKEVDAVRAAVAEAVHRKLPPKWWQVHDYVDDMGGALAAADVVVCRAGATTIAELTAIGRAAVLVPYPYATDDHQSCNAAPLLQAGAAAVVSDAGLDTPAFADDVLRLLEDPRRRESMAAAAAHLARPCAATAVVDAAIEAATAKSPWRSEVRVEAAEEIGRAIGTVDVEPPALPSIKPAPAPPKPQPAVTAAKPEPAAVPAKAESVAAAKPQPAAAPAAPEGSAPPVATPAAPEPPVAPADAPAPEGALDAPATTAPAEEPDAAETASDAPGPEAPPEAENPAEPETGPAVSHVETVEGGVPA